MTNYYYKYIICILSACFVLSACSKQRTNDLIEEQLKGNVKHITTTAGQYTTEDDEAIFDNYTYTEEIFFDRNGLKTHAIMLDEEQQLNLQCVYEHDKYGNITLADMRDASEQSIIKNVFQYDSNGYLTKMLSLDDNNHTDLTIVYINDSIGRQIQQSVYDYVGRLVRIEKTIYLDNPTDNMLKDKSMNIVVGTTDTTITSYAYNDLWQLIERTDFSNDMTSTYQYQYDNYGNAIVEIYTANDIMHRQHNKYIYDSQGNWINKITYHVDNNNIETPTFIWTRTIEYY